MESNKFIPVLGRILIGVPFILTGLSKLGAYAATTAYISAMGLPAPTLAYIMAVVVELGGGALLLAGYQVRLVSLVLAVFSVATAVIFHNNFGDQNQMIHFLKNIMMAGGLLQITYFGAGAWSLDASARKPAAGVR